MEVHSSESSSLKNLQCVHRPQIAACFSRVFGIRQFTVRKIERETGRRVKLKGIKKHPSCTQTAAIQ